jgi:hypothetical protein
VASAARKAFDKNCLDIQRLLDIHARLTGTAPGRRSDVEVLNKSAIVLITAFWEAYCEDLAAEALRHLITAGKDASCVPVDLRKQVVKEFKQPGANELAAWNLADNGWRTLLQARLTTLQAARNRNLNTPKTAEINQLFLRATGEPEVSRAWYWTSMTRERAAQKLDDYVTLRGEVAHRGAAAAGVQKPVVEAYYNHVRRLVSKTGGRLNTHCRKATGKALF